MRTTRYTGESVATMKSSSLLRSLTVLAQACASGLPLAGLMLCPAHSSICRSLRSSPKAQKSVAVRRSYWATWRSAQSTSSSDASSSSSGALGISRKFSIHSNAVDSDGAIDSDGDGIGDFQDAFVSSLAMILVAELGDETFIIAAIMAMRHPRAIVLSGALSALAIMTVLSTALGVIAPMLISPKVVNKCAFVLYTFFGCRLFYIAWRSKPGASMQEEVDEVAEKIDVDKAPKGKVRRILSRICTPIFLEAFVLTFLAEWGDRSQITTIALAAHKDPYGVTIGAIVGHAFCTSLAVIGGKILALKISQRLVAVVGGMLFIVFAWHALIFGAPGTELSKND